MKVFKDSSRISGGVFFAFSLCVIITASRFHSTGSDPIGPGGYPVALATAIMFLSALLVVMGQRKKAPNQDEDSETTDSSTQWKSLFVTLAAMIVYISVFQSIGFIFSTILLLFGLTMYFDRGNWKGALSYSICFTAGLYLVFSVLLKILLPTVWL